MKKANRILQYLKGIKLRALLQEELKHKHWSLYWLGLESMPLWQELNYWLLLLCVGKLGEEKQETAYGGKE